MSKKVASGGGGSRLKKGARCYDSVQKCEMESDIFRTIRFHSTPFAKTEYKIDTTQPSEESQKRKLEKEVRERFYSGNLPFGSEKFSFVGWIVKTVFLVIALPFYLVLYALPRWICLFVLRKIYESLCRFFRPIIRFAQMVKQYLMKPFYFLREVVDVIKGHTVKGKEKFQSFSPKAFILAMAFKVRVFLQKGYFRRYAASVRKMFSSLEMVLRNFLRPLEQKINSYFKTFISLITSPFIKLYHTSIRIPFAWISNKYMQIRKQWKEGVKSLKSSLQWMKNEFRSYPRRFYVYLTRLDKEVIIPFFAYVKKTFISIRQSIRDFRKSCIQFIKELPSNTYKAFINTCYRVKQKLRDFKSSAILFYKKIKNDSKIWVKAQYYKCIHYIKNAPKWCMNWIKFQMHQAYIKLVTYSRQKVNQVLQPFRDAKSWMQINYGKCISFAGNAFTKTKLYASVVREYLKKGAVVIKKNGYLAWIWCKIVVRHGIKTVQEITYSIEKKIIQLFEE